MILAVADYAERRPDASPPPELLQAMRCQRYPGALPFDGSLGSQPAGLLDRMEYYLWAYETIRSFHKAKSWNAWQIANPQGWKLKVWIDRTRKRMTEHA
jgi:hypothetical protein